MICTVLAGKTFEEILDILQDPFVEMAEIRLDSCRLSDKEISDLFSECEKPLVATCRLESWDEAISKLGLAIESGATFADLDVGAPAPVSKRFRRLCEENDTRIIRSWHSFDGTPDLDYLRQIVERCYRYGADVAKVITTCRDEADCLSVLSLYDSASDPSRLVAFGMGEEGRGTRIECLKRGAPFSYAALSEEETVAPGQWSVEKMHEAVYGELPGFWRDSLQMPCSKSFAQRAIIAAALAEGTSHLSGYTPCEDSESAIRAAKALGAKVFRRADTLTITGIACRGEMLPCLESVDAGESGLLARLMIPIAAALGPGLCTVTGERTLLQRPLPGAADIMASFGVVLKGTKVPVEVCGRLLPGIAEISGRGGSQLISGLLFALPLLSKATTLKVSDPKSLPYMFITLDVLKKFGVRIECEMEGEADLLEAQDWSGCTDVVFRTRGGQALKAADLRLEADWSSAAPFLVAGAVFGFAEVCGLDMRSLQADLSILDVLVEAGAGVSVYEDDGVVMVRKAPLEAFTTDLSNAPDLFPSVAVLAAFCPGQSRIAGMGRLASKESDRGAAILESLRKMGVEASREGDELVVEGKSLAQRSLSGEMILGGKYSCFRDHRMAMALKIASLGCPESFEIEEKECVAKSFPEFFCNFDV